MSVKRPKGPNRLILWLFKSGKRSIFVTDSYLNDNAFTAVKRIQVLNKVGEMSEICQ